MNPMKRITHFFSNFFAHLMAVPSRISQLKIDRKMNNFVVVVAIYFLTVQEMILDPVIAIKPKKTNVCSNQSSGNGQIKLESEECRIANKDKSKLKNKQNAG